MLTPGSEFGKYRIIDRIGQGGTGTVYKASRIEDNLLVALKILDPESAGSADYRKQIESEARASVAVSSPHVAKALEYDATGDTPYIVMEFVGGPELREAIEGLDFGQKVDLAVQIGLGVQAAHEQGLVHRDLKPENVKLDDAGMARILDFGLAQQVDCNAVDEYGNVAGTLYYLSPEQLTGEPISHSADLFAFGTMLYEMFTGVRPFEGEYSSSIIYSILHEDPIPPSQIKEELPSWFDQLVMRLLQKRPTGRYESMGETVKFLQSHRDLTVDEEKYVRPHQTVTVVDLRNMSGDPGWEYFCEGFTDDVIKELSRRTSLVVSAEPSTSHRRNIKETFQKCRSDFVLVGSLMKWQEKIKLSLAVYGEDGDKLVWDADFAESSDRLFELLGEAARQASIQLSEASHLTAIGVEEERHIDVTAYDFYLKGRSYYQTNKPEDLEFARQMFLKALEAEPEFALAHAGLSDVYTFEYMAYYDRTDECIGNARKHAEEALRLEPHSPEGLRSLGRYHMFKSDFKRANECFLQAVEYNPKYAIGYRTLGWLKMYEGDYAAALDWSRKALELSPTDLETLLLLSLLNMGEGNYTVAMSTLQRAIELGPDYGRAYYELGQAYLKLGVPELAIQNLELACKYKGDPNCYVDAGSTFYSLGNYARARDALHKAIEENSFPFVAHYYLGLVDQAEGDDEQARGHFLEAMAALKDYDFSQAENLPMQAYLALSRAAVGLKDEALQTLADMEQHRITNGEVILNTARCYALLEDRVRAMRLIQQAVSTKGGPSKRQIQLDPHFSFLMNDPWFLTP